MANTTSTINTAPTSASKSTTTLIARLALAGHVVHQAEGGDFLVTRWGQTRYCADLAELQAFAVKVGVNHE